jgi:hypothetical protein
LMEQTFNEIVLGKGTNLSVTELVRVRLLA